MATAAEHAEVVFTGILPRRKDLLDVAMRRLTPDHFEDKKHSNLFRMLEIYSDAVNSVIPRQNLDDLLSSKVEEAQYLLYMELYDYFAESEVEDSAFYWSVEQLRELAAEKATGEAIVEAMEILKKGKEIKPGTLLKGHAEARERILDSLSVIDRDLNTAEVSEGYVHDEYDEILSEYEENKAKRLSGEVQGIGFGIEALDDVTGGMQNGDLVIVAASASHGKSSLSAQSAWYAATQQGKNVVFFATETGRAVIRRKLISRHSKLEAFGLPDGLNMRNLKEGSLTDREESILRDVAQDLRSNPDYGKIFLSQVPRGATIATLEHKIARIARNQDCDFVVMDYLALLESTTRVTEDRNKYVNTLREAKMVATGAAAGVGVPFLSPWQINRAGRDSAETSGYYTMNDLADTSEAEKIADMVISLYRSDEETGRFAEGNIQLMKMRDGERARDILVDIDYATCTFTSKSGLSALPKTATNAGAGFTSLDGLY